jgi:anaerobic magnesium-protoporphyrin IX monomethyl ester cyclase
MKVLLTHGYFLRESENELEKRKPYPLLGILYISAFLKKNSMVHSVFDSTFSSKQELFDYILNEKPDIIGFYVSLLTKLNILKIILQIRNNEVLKNTKIILGGPDVSYNIENYLHNGADVLVIGEGEISFYELLLAIEGNRDISDVNGIAFCSENGDIVSTLPRVRIDNLDNLDWPNRESIDIKIYLETWKTYQGFTSLNISTQRGCPFSCKWCSRGVFGHKFIQRSVDSVVKEIEYLAQTYQVQSIRFVEDLFTLDQAWIKMFCESLIHKKLPVTFECTTRAETLNEEIILLLKKAGCYQIWIGTESGSQDVINTLNTKTDINKIISALQLIKKNGIETGTFIIIGFPGEKRIDIIKTMDFLRTVNPDHTAFSIAYPIKGTDFYNEVEPVFKRIPEWSLSTDRAIEFKQMYNRRFYKYAMSWMANEMKYSKNKKTDLLFAVKSKIKSILSFHLMNLESIMFTSNK